MKFPLKLYPRRLALAVVFLALNAAAVCAQSMPGYRAPDKPKPKEESLLIKAARGQAPLRNLYDYLKPDPARTRRLPVLDESEKKKKLPGKVLTIGVVRTLAQPINPDTDATIYQTNDGDVRVMSVISTGARYTRVQFSKMGLPAGARVFVYSLHDPNEFYGPYESQGLGEKGTFWTPPMKGEGVVIEYFAPKSARASETPFRISKVTHVHTDPLTAPKVGSCHNDVTAPWTDTAKSVGWLDIVGDQVNGLCTGTLLASPNPFPYLLTANHCFDTQAEAQSLRVYWNYNNSDPSGDPPPGTPFTDGAVLLATGTSSDFTLVRLTGTLPGGLFFSGWDASNFIGSENGTGLHHPDGSYKRISLGTARQPTAGECPAGLQCLTVDWNRTANPGVTENGSSGSGIWKGEPTDPGGAKLIGQLWGGPSACTESPPNRKDYYGRFSTTYHFIAPIIGSNCATSVNPTSQNFPSAGGGGSFTVNAPGSCNWTATTGTSWISITPPGSGPGNGTVNFTVAANGGNQRSGTIVVSGQVFNITQSAGTACSPVPISLGQTVNGTLSTSACPLGDGRFYDVYSFNGTVGQNVFILMRSTQIDSYLFLNQPGGLNIAQDDDGAPEPSPPQGTNLDSRIPAISGFVTLPATGTYTIFASSFGNGEQGAYTLTLDGPVPATRTLTVASLNPNSGVAITVSPTDNGGQNNGTTEFTRTYNQNLTVTLTAPSTASGNVFQEWRKDGVFDSSSLTRSVTMDVNHTMTAVYGPPPTRTLTVASLNPNSGVAITVSPNDNGGQGNGTTQFTRTYNHNTDVTLRAAGTTPEGNPFKRWLRNGSHFNSLLDAIVTLTADTTMTAEYYIKPKIYGEENNPSAAAALNSVTFSRGPFRILDEHNFAADGHTRIIIFTNDLGLTNPLLNDAAVLRVEADGTILPIEAYGSLTGVPGLTGSYIVVKLQPGLPTNTPLNLVVWLFGINSDAKTITIIP